MSQHDEDGAMVCAKCGITFDCHGALSPNCVSDEQGYTGMLAREVRGYRAGCGRCKALREAIEYAVEMLDQLPMGCDDEAREDDPSPRDAVAHIGGLVQRRLRLLL
jgi:hypothetical protein